MYYLELYYKTNSGKKGMVEFEMEEYNDEETEICEMINKALEIKDEYDIKEITHFDIIEGDEEDDEDEDDEDEDE